jgi:dephospho-CoA kinase
MEVRLQRAMQRDHADEPSIRHRMSHQMSDNELLQRATHIIHNDERHSLIAQVQQLIATLTERTAEVFCQYISSSRTENVFLHPQQKKNIKY